MSISSITSSIVSSVAEDNVVLYTEEYKPLFWPVLILVLPFMPLLWKYHVTITNDGLSFGYSSIITSKRIKHRTKTIKEATPLFDQKWGGWGIHYRPDPNHNLFGPWERFYIANNGGAVKLVLADDVDDNNEAGKHDGSDGSGDGSGDTTTFYFSTNDPQKVCDILNKKA
jgi:hypothetical protein